MQRSDDHASGITPPQRRIELEQYDADQQVLAGVEQLRFFPLVVDRGTGARLITPSGRELIDFSASWTASSVGHSHPAVVSAVSEAIRQQAGASVLSSGTTSSTALARRLADAVPVRGARRSVYLGLAGTDANDVAVRAAKQFTRRDGVVAFSGSYHGGFGMAQGISGIGRPSGEDAPEACLLPYPTTDEHAQDVLARLERILAARRIAVVVAEAVQCDGGVIVPAPGLLRGLREACDRHETLLLLDEVKAGLGRTGHRFAFQPEGIEPDIVTLGKSLGGGLPISAAVARTEVLAEPVASALLTTAGNPVVCAAASAAFEVLSDTELHQRVGELGDAFCALASDYQESSRQGAVHLGAVRGRGLLQGLEIVASDGTPDSALASKTVYRAWELGCVAYLVRGNVIECTPPLMISEDDLATGLNRILQALDDAAAGVVSDEEIAAYSGW